jgi:hypothetical protein
LGLRTLPAEDHIIPGGCASSCRSGRFEFEAARHQLSEVDLEAQPYTLRELFEKLGVAEWLPYRARVDRLLAHARDLTEASRHATSTPGCSRGHASSVPAVRSGSASIRSQVSASISRGARPVGNGSAGPCGEQVRPEHRQHEIPPGPPTPSPQP